MNKYGDMNSVIRWLAWSFLAVLILLVQCSLFSSEDTYAEALYNAVFKDGLLVDGEDTLSYPLALHTGDINKEAEWFFFVDRWDTLYDSSIYGYLEVSRNEVSYMLSLSDSMDTHDTVVHEYGEREYFSVYDKRITDQCSTVIACIPFNASEKPELDYEKSEFLGKKAFDIQCFWNDTGYYHTEIHIRKYKIWRNSGLWGMD